MLDLRQIVVDVGNAVVALDQSRISFKQFQAGAGPYGEPQLVRFIAECLNLIPAYGSVKTKRSPDLVISGQWALEFKIVRPFGDNGKEAENWSVNLLHPYQGNISLIGDCLKLVQMDILERKGVILIGYEHTPPVIKLETLLNAFEIIARDVMFLHLGERTQILSPGLCHPVHQQLLVAGWEVLGQREGSKC